MTKYIVSILVFIASASFVMASSSIEITYIMCNPIGSDVDGEYIKVKNISGAELDLTGWKFNDGSNHTLNIPPKNGGVGDLILVSDETAILANKADKVSGESTVIDTVMSLSNSGDTVKLLDESGAEAISVSYTKSDVVEGESCLTGSSSDSSASRESSGASSTIVTTKVNEITTYRTVEIEPPQDIHIRQIANKKGLLGGIIYFNPEIYGATGRISEASCYVTFGDGTLSNKCDASHIYNYSGDYIVKLMASKDTLNDEITFKVKIIEPDLYITVGGPKEYVELHNTLDIDVELNGWMVKVGYKRFDIPEHTTVPATGTIKISGKSMKADIARLGGKAELYNVFNKVVQMEPVNIEEVVVESTTPSVASTTMGATSSSTNMQMEIVLRPTIKTRDSHIVAKRSVIGLVMSEISEINKKETALNNHNTTIDKEAVENYLDTKVERQSQIASASLLPSLSSPWMYAVIGLLLLAVLPLIFGKAKDGGHQDLVDDSDLSDKFSIKEIM